MFDIKKTKAVLWDLDDTLFSRVEAARRTFPGMFKALLYKDRDDAFINEAVDFMMEHRERDSMVHESAFNALIEKYPPDKPYIRNDCLDYYYDYIGDFAVPFDDSLNVVKKLRSLGIKNAIVTNITEDRLYSQKRKVEVLGIAEYFDAIVYSGEFGVHKPDPRIYYHAAELLGVSKDDCLFVGDSPDSDIPGALNSGMESVWIDHFEYDGRFADEPSVHRVKSVLEYFKL